MVTAVLGAIALPSAAQAAKAQTGGAEAELPPDAVGATPALGGELAAGPIGRARFVAGRAMAPAGAPPAVVAAIAAANRIVGKPYRYGGGHRSFEDAGYDCSGAVSYALRGAGVLRAPLDSSAFMRWGAAGRGRWITIYTNPGHAYVVIAGLRFDTSLGDRSAPLSLETRAGGRGPRWGGPRSARGFTVRHPVGL